MGNIDNGEPVLARIHSQCLTGDTLGSLKCDCGQQLDFALKNIAKEKKRCSVIHGARRQRDWINK